jgi:hypothetical protein
MSRQTNTIAVTTIGIDTGKNTLHLIGLDEHGTIVLREKLARGRIRTRLANVPPCLIGIEAGMPACAPTAMVVPLTAEAATLLSEMKRQRGSSPWVFPSDKSARCVMTI